MTGSLPLWIHIVAATVWVGPQVMMFVVVVPSLRALDDPRDRTRLLAALTPRFGWLGLGALLVLVLTGIDNIRRYAPSDVFDIRYGYILVTKLVMVTIVILVTVYHSFVVGPSLLRLQSEAATDGAAGARLRSARLQSIVISSLTLVLSLLILLCATLLRSAFGNALV